MCWVPGSVPLRCTAPGIAGVPLAFHPSGDRSCAHLASFKLLRRIALMDRYWVYILASKRNGTLYIGVTNDIVRRVNEHKSKAFAGFSARYNVCILVWHEEHSSIIDAQAREKSLKKWLNPAWTDLHEHLM
jgi:putative endonuclease